MPKKIRTLDAEIKSILTRKQKPNPMQKIKGMGKEHIIQKHDDLLKMVREDLDRLEQKQFFAPPPIAEIQHIPLHEVFPPAPVGMIAVDPNKLCMGVEVGSQKFEEMIEFMRADLACGMGYSRIIDTVRKRMIEDGKDFDEEFRKWKEDRDAIKKYGI